MISTDPTSDNFDWSSLEGTTLKGGYQVEEPLSADDRTACFRIRVLGEYRRNAFANFYRVRGPAAQEQLDIWQTARQIRHPNLSAPLGTGRLPFQDSEVVYVVIDKPNEVLSGVLQKRELVSQEAEPILRGLESALKELHARDLVHGTLSPDQVFAFGDSIKLSTEGLRRANSAPPLSVVPAKYLAPESTGENVTPEADIWCMGATLFEALTQKQCGPTCREDAGSLPDPWKRILQKCLETDPAQRARLSDLDRLRAGEPVGEVAPVAAPAPLINEPQTGTSTAGEQELSSFARRQSVTPVERTSRASRSWIYAAVALVLVVLLLWAARPKHPATVPGPQPPAQTARANQPRSSWPTRTLTPDTAPRDAHPDARLARPRQPVLARPGDPAVWRVVLYTFSREDDAQKRAQAINQQHPGLNTQVFSPSGKNRMYLVVAGGRMSRDQAAQLRQQAVREGMPHDSYIQNYKQ